jgi:cyclase
MRTKHLRIYNLVKILLLPFFLGSTGVMAADSDNTLQLLHVQGKVYMLSGGDVNVSIQMGDDALVFVDTPAPEIIPEVMSLVRELSERPIRYIITTHLDSEHIAGNDGMTSSASEGGRQLNQGESLPGFTTAISGAREGINIIAHENVLNRFYMTDSAIEDLTITSSYFDESMDFYENEEGVFIYHMPNAHTDGDSIVYFRRSDVISAGDIYTPGLYPDIDIARGGSVDGFVDALNFIIKLTVPTKRADGGTLVVPGHGRISDEIDVVEYRNMLYIVRDRIADMIENDMNLDEILSNRPTFDYDLEYGRHRGGPSNEEFITAIYQSLMQE